MKRIIIILSINLFLITLIICLYLKNQKVNIDDLYSSLVYIESKRDNTKIKGSGFVYDIKDSFAYIITNYHVVGASDNVIVYDRYKNKSVAKVVDYDELYDIAVIKVRNQNFKKIILGNSDNLQVFDEIYTFGNPLGLEYFGTVNKGIVSYVDRKIKVNNINSISEYYSIQIDAPINNGNSGGALLDKKRKVVGIISIKENDLNGVGFAIPINFVKKIIDNMNIK